MAAPALDKQTILAAVQSWPEDEQIAFAEEILALVQGPIVEEPLESPDSRSLVGLLANGQTPPTDEEVAQWLDEHRMEKYGR